MDKAALVSVDLERGSEIVDALEHANLRLSVAVWLYSAEYEDWRMVISSRRFDALEPRDAYRLLNDLISAAGLTPEKMPAVMILPMSDPFVKHLRRVFKKSKSVEGMRLGGQVIGDRFVQDAYVYRIS